MTVSTGSSLIAWRWSGLKGTCEVEEGAVAAVAHRAGCSSPVERASTVLAALGWERKAEVACGRSGGRAEVAL